jgi:hypothetical protein
VRDVIFDHCSVSWGSDTQLDWYGSVLDRATFQWNLIAEGYMGQHIGGNRAPKNLTLHHNLYANLGSRTPLMQHADVFDFRNNVIYNWSGNNASVFGQFALNTSAFGNVVGNLWLAGSKGGYPYLNVGAYKPSRDAIDRRVANSVRAKAGSSRREEAHSFQTKARASSPRLLRFKGSRRETVKLGDYSDCHQVSDCETWQEYLAGHLGEPIRNFGMGGYGVYQA